MRYAETTMQKKNGVVYTPDPMADFLAREMLKDWRPQSRRIRILDPAAGGGDLIAALASLVRERYCGCSIAVTGYETDSAAAEAAEARLSGDFPEVSVRILNEDFLEAVASGTAGSYDLIIANPPYVRTQILGTHKAQEIAERLSLKGRVDMYYAFLLAAGKVLAEGGMAGFITSNKFLSIRSGCSVRNFMLENYSVREIVDLGDTMLFSASVLPCILVFSPGKTEDGDAVSFTSVYETDEDATTEAGSILDALKAPCVCRTPDGRHYKVQRGTLQGAAKDALWTLKTQESVSWLSRADANTWERFKDIGKVRVGIKTTADNVFIGSDLKDMELLRPLITHRNAGHIIPNNAEQWKVLYTSTTEDGRRTACDLDEYPASRTYLLTHYDQLSSRAYLKGAGRKWYEIWVPQNPDSWQDRKIVFRDISEHPEFWLDTTGAVVNGDCYWIDISPDTPDDVVYLALAVANSTFIERYYDLRFNTKLYSGKRRFMTQYVEQFPIPYYGSQGAQRAISIVKDIISTPDKDALQAAYAELDSTVSRLFA
ncbi:MAG: N-6 DNA methylase [Clostridia bacterium]|nr:N-6 DNA methylase [Clostridia bacterium]